jgi:hypothetical protein
MHYLRNAYLAQFPSRGVDKWLKREGELERASKHFRSRYPNFFYGDDPTEFIGYEMIEKLEGISRLLQARSASEWVEHRLHFPRRNPLACASCL